MADPSTYRPPAGTIPPEPGVYRFRDAQDRVIYVGKAKNLRSRLSSYFQELSALHPRTRQMVTTAAAVDWTVVTTEVEALQLEYSWIKEFDPRFNVKYRDDKSYPSLAVTLHEEYPRLLVMRGAKRPGVRYFGPYSHAWAIRETLDLLLRAFPARSCSAGVFRRAQRIGRACLLGDIGKCSAPCVGRVSAAEHRQIVLEFCDFMAGRTDRFVRNLERQMAAAARELEFERAARIRDQLAAVRRAMEKNAVVLGDGTDADVVAFAEDPLEAAVQIFHVRQGRIRGERGWVVDKVADVSTEELVQQFLTQFYGGDYAEEVPREILVPRLPPDVEAVAAWLAARRGAAVSVRVPVRGDKRALQETVRRNAEQSFTQHKLRRATDLGARSRALREIQEALGLPEAPLRIECFDVSHVQGTNAVASMVVFEDGMPRRGEYRHFVMRGDADAADDTAWMRQTLRRRFARHQEPDGDRADGAGGDDDRADGGDRADDGGRNGAGAASEVAAPRRRFAYPPNLVLVDGGAPQVAAAAQAAAEQAVTDVHVAGLAKRLEEVWLPGDSEPVILPRRSEGLYLLQRIRDEAHRFAITFHRQRRSRAMTSSALDEVPGLGAARRRALLGEFGSVNRIRSATVAELMAVPGVGRRTAEAVLAALAQRPAGPAVDPVTGEILDGSGEAGGRSPADGPASAVTRGDDWNGVTADEPDSGPRGPAHGNGSTVNGDRS